MAGSKKREDMSYRSEVAIVFDKTQLSMEDLEAARHLLKKLNEAYKPTKSIVQENERYIQFYHDFLKWSHTDREVKAIHNFFDLELINENAYSYIRVGEEIGDIELKGNSSDGILILQQVDQDSLPISLND